MLDDTTGRWGIRVNRVELKAIDPPVTIQEAMEKQMRAERDRRAAILTAEEGGSPGAGGGEVDGRGRGWASGGGARNRRGTEPRRVASMA